MPDYAVREATLADLEALVHHRVAMFTEIGSRPGDVPAFESAYRSWLRRMMPAGDYIAWVAETADRQIVAGAGISLLTWPPGPRPAGSDRIAFVYNVYTEPVHRKRGLARRLMETIHAWCAGRGIAALSLNAAANARPLYDSMGYFEAQSPMMWKIM